MVVVSLGIFSFAHQFFFFLGSFENTGTSSLWGRKPLTACKSPDTVVVYL